MARYQPRQHAQVARARAATEVDDVDADVGLGVGVVRAPARLDHPTAGLLRVLLLIGQIADSHVGALACPCILYIERNLVTRP